MSAKKDADVMGGKQCIYIYIIYICTWQGSVGPAHACIYALGAQKLNLAGLPASNPAGRS